jgi:hypothetical protein
MRPARILVASLALLLAGAHHAAAQQDSLQPVHSLGQPPRWKPYVGAFAAGNQLSGDASFGGLGVVGVFHDLLPPVAGVGMIAEGYAGTLGDGFDGGVRVGLFLPVFFTHAGLDYAFGNGQLDFLVGINAPLRRGGILGSGTRLRVDWLPGRSQTVDVGITVPIRQGPMGKTRPPTHKVATPRAPKRRPGALEQSETDRARALAEMDRSQQWLLAAVSVLDRGRGDTHESVLVEQRARVARFVAAADSADPLRPEGRSYERELAVWHQQMAVAFGLATGAPAGQAMLQGTPIAALARRALLDEVLLPYDALFGQHKDPADLFGFGASGRDVFDESLPASLTGDARARVNDTFDRIVRMLDEQRAGRIALEDGDGRYGWLPLQLALLPEEYDGQAELNALLARLAGRPFVAGNRLAYVVGGQFRATLARQITAARHYHVLWVHDFPGVNGAGDPDSVAFQTTLTYLKALTGAARAYDARRRFTQYYVFLDEHYYDARNSRLWMDMLERPLRHRMQLPPGFTGMTAALAAQQDSLRAAVAASVELQAEAKRRGRDWLERVVKVHVNITHPADASFISSHMVIGAPFVPDNIARDHRKLAFMDLTTDDSTAGSAILAGVGVGENYANPTWDDRALAIAGPAALTLLEEVQRLMRRNGFPEDRIPAVLRADDRELDHRAPSDATATGVMIATNDVGFGQKAASAVQMGLLTLMPAGSLIYVPDSIWTSMIYASELVVAALRGCHVRIIAPARANAPSAAPPTMARTWDLFTRLLEVQLGLRDRLRERRGDLRVGFYQRQSRLDDPAGLMREVADGLEREPWLVDEMSLARASASMRAFADSIDKHPVDFGQTIQDTLSRAPRFHAKTQLFLTGPAFRGLLDNRQLRPLAWSSVLPTMGVQLPMDSVGMPLGSDELMDLAARAAAGLSPDSVAMFLTVGSQNKDLRSMLLDGEIKATVAGPKALIGLLEFVQIMGLSRFPESQAELETLMPPWSERTRRLAYKIRRAL